MMNFQIGINRTKTKDKGRQVLHGNKWKIRIYFWANKVKMFNKQICLIKVNAKKLFKKIVNKTRFRNKTSKTFYNI